MKFSEGNNPISQNEIEEFEKLISGQLSRDYREFLLKYNGGKPELYIFPETDDTYSLPIGRFYGLKAKNINDDLVQKYDVYDERIMNQFIPVANEIGGDQFVLGISGKFKGKVYFWDHNTELENDEFVEDELPGNMYLLADSFDDFINQLEEDKEA